MALEDPYAAPPWPPPLFGQQFTDLPEYGTTTGIPTLPTNPPTQHVTTAEYDPGLAAGTALGTPTPPPPAPPQPPPKESPKKIGATPNLVQDEVAARPESLTAAELAAGDERGPSNAELAGPPVPQDPYAAAAPPPPDQQLAMFGVPTTPAPNGDMQSLMYGTPGAPPPPTEGPPANAAPQNPYLTDEEKDVAAGEAAAARPDAQEQLIKDTAIAEESKRRAFVAGQLEANTARMKQAEQAHNAYVAAQEHAAADRALIENDAKKIAQYDPQHWMKSRSAGEMLLAAAAIVTGGLAQGKNGQNLGLEMIKKQIEDDNSGQQFNIQTQRADLTRRSGAVNEQLRSAEEREREANLYANTMYEAQIGVLQTQQMDFDPHGTASRQITAQILQLRAAQKQMNDAWQEKQAKDTEAKIKLVQEQEKIDETSRHNRADEGFKAAKLGAGAGAGSATNPNYTVATGFFDPFTNAPIYGKQAIGGKGKEKFEDATRAQIATYAHVQDYWDELNKVGAEIGYAKSVPEMLTSARKGTLETKYDQAREALTVYLTKELGDKLTQGQLEAQAHRIPTRANVFEARDPGRLIRDAQTDADRDFTRDMNLVGIDAAPIVTHAQQHRADAPLPTGDEAIAAAQGARAKAATSTERKDADAALSAAKAQKKQEVELEAHAGEEVDKAATASPRPILNATGGVSTDIATDLAARNSAAERYNQRLQQFHALPAVPDTKGKAKGDAVVAAEHHDKQLKQAAIKIAQERKALNTADEDLDTRLYKSITSSDFGGLPPALVESIAHRYTSADPSKFGDDINGQVERGKFNGELKRLDKFKRTKLTREMRRELFGQ